jgi:branched-chain amino acid transport system permease protein
MNQLTRGVLGFSAMAACLIAVGVMQSWTLSFTIINMCLISAVMALGVNIQWGYAGLFNAGIVGFTALGGLAAMLVSTPPVTGAWRAGGVSLFFSLLALIAVVVAVNRLRRYIPAGRVRSVGTVVLIVGGFFFIRYFYAPAVDAIESFDPARTGFLGGLGAPILFSWLVGGLFAAGAAWLIGKISLGLRSDYLAIATLGIAEIIVAMLKNEDWLSRGVKNVSGLPRPVPYEIELQQTPWFVERVTAFYAADLPVDATARAAELQQKLIEASSLFVKLCYTGLFLSVLLLVLWLAYRAQRAPWGRMMRAIRDNEDAANAMGKDVTRRHLQVFVMGSAVVGIAGAMMTTLEGQLTPGTYNPLRYTFLIWVMVIIGGSGNNIGSVLGAFIVWFGWVQAEPLGQWVIDHGTAWMGDGHALREHMLENASHMRLIIMGTVLLLVMRFSPNGLIPETNRQ